VLAQLRQRNSPENQEGPLHDHGKKPAYPVCDWSRLVNEPVKEVSQTADENKKHVQKADLVQELLSLFNHLHLCLGITPCQGRRLAKDNARFYINDHIHGADYPVGKDLGNVDE